MAEIDFNRKEWEVSEALQAFYVPYASYVIQTRALPDARDGLKTGARFILYSQFKDKLTYKEKKRKAVATVNAAMRFSPHGDSSIFGTAVRMSQDFSLRYPVIEVQGNNGSYLSGDDYSQPRYLEMRGNKIAWDMTNLLNKDTIDEWKLNYTEEEEYPAVLPSKFPYGLVNGSFGIGVACSSSLPPHNINDVCDAAITLINNPNCDFEDIYCPIDFPTGGTIINEAAVKESLKNGTGKAALVRATIEYDDKENELVVKEVPYMTFTNTIVKSISKALDEGILQGVSGVIDGTDFDGCKIYIQLTKGANINKVLKLLYKHTALQSSFSINMNMLEDGKIPKLFTWKGALEAYVSHLRTIIVKAYEFDLDKLKKRIHILDGLIIAYQNIEEIVKLIRSSSSTTVAKSGLISNFNLTEAQADAILKMRLSSLTHLEIEKLEKWAEDVKKSIELELKNLDIDIKFKKAEARKMLKLEDKLNMQKEIKELEKKRNNLRFNLFEEQDKVDERKEKLIENIENKMKQKIEIEDLFKIKFKII
jgi:DNA gyrase subunit A